MQKSFSRDFVRHPLHYFSLLVLETIGVWAVFWFNFQPTIQYLAVVYMALVYVSWGVFHHQKNRDLHPKIVLEYVLFALIGLLLLGLLIFKP